MLIASDNDLKGISQVSEVVAITLKKMKAYCEPGISTKQIDDYGKKLLSEYGARSAPSLTYDFPGCTCISINNEIAHGVPSTKKIIKEGDLINIDVSAELNGYWSDNGGSFILGNDIHHHSHLVNTSKEILRLAIDMISDKIKIADVGRLINNEAKKAGYTVIKNLTGHGVGKSLHEYPKEIANYGDAFDRRRFKKGYVVAVETFISTKSNYTNTDPDNWTLTGDKGGFVAQHEHTIIITEGKPQILTLQNGIWD
ncbi:MAG: type I methionyl aminopeptidase [Bacteroidota bacterium]|nr:type I methionyl aminopeptidase [Bacteroidota bacterium]